jgi:adenylate cyclase
MRSRSGRNRLWLFVGVGAAATAISLAAYTGHVLRNLELSSVDTRFALRGSTGEPKDVVVVGIDEKTDAWFTNHGMPWPYPRRYHAKVIDRIVAGKASAIGVDIEFVTPAPKEADDFALVDSIQRAGNVVLSATQVDEHGNSNVFGSSATVRSFGAHDANTQIILDPHGVLRHMQESIEGLVTFGVALAAVAQGKPVPRAPTGSHWIDFAGPPDTVKTYSYVDVLQGNVPPTAFRGKTVVIGAPVGFLQDAFATSAAAETMSGPEIQANTIETALRGYPLRSAPIWLNALLIVALGMLPVLTIRLGAVYTFVIAVAAGVLFAVAVQFAFNHGTVVLFTYPLLALALSAIGALIVWYILEAFERALTRDVFARFVPEAVVSQVLARTGGELRLGGEKVFGTVMFTDLRGFTTFSEGHEADEVIGLLNTYLSSMSDSVLAHGGTLVTYTGDGMMAVFGAPLPQPDHADRALATARDMLEVRLPAFNEWLHEQGHDYKFKMGVGLNSGDFMSGNVGSERRLEYTAIGDTINTSSRIEGLTKGTPYALYLAGSTRDALLDPPDDLVYVDEMPIRGREHTIPIWSLTSHLIQKENWESEIAKPATRAPEPPEPAAPEPRTSEPGTSEPVTPDPVTPEPSAPAAV